MIFLRTELGAVKCALRDLLREALTVVENFIVGPGAAAEGGEEGDQRWKPRP